jgi:hypothetical protein
VEVRGSRSGSNRSGRGFRRPARTLDGQADCGHASRLQGNCLAEHACWATVVTAMVAANFSSAEAGVRGLVYSSRIRCGNWIGE